MGALHLVDFDLVDESNLNRQHYFREHLGRPKTEALAEQLRRIDPGIELTLDRVRVDAGNAAALFAARRIVCEAFDDPRCKADLVNALLTEAPNTGVVAGSGMSGCGTADALVTRRVGRRLFVCGDGEADVADEALFARGGPVRGAAGARRRAPRAGTRRKLTEATGRRGRPGRDIHGIRTGYLVAGRPDVHLALHPGVKVQPRPRGGGRARCGAEIVTLAVRRATRGRTEASSAPFPRA
ncbi:MAG: ThiF family adenylyltransferase [Eggerthellaceae bacterium]